MATVAVEVVYRGIYQKTLARNIVRSIVFAARKEGKIGTAFGRYGDSPERNGIPAKQFAIVADSPEELEENLAVYQAQEVDVTINVDDTMCKGIESWAWYGLEPINKLTKSGGTIIVTSRQQADALVEDIHQRSEPYNLAIVPATVSFSGLWVYKDDHTDARLLGALCKVCPQLVSLESMVAALREQGMNELKVVSAQKSYDRITQRPVEPGEGSTEIPFSFELPGWKKMEEGLVIRGIAQGGGFRGGELGYEPVRNETFKKWSTRSMRPVVNFETCIKCTLCWLQCPDTCFDVTPDGLYDANMESCCGCGVCDAVCPVPNCITMVNEAEFNDNNSQWEAWQKDPASYKQWMTTLTEKQNAGEERSHGFHHVGGYAEQIAKMGDS
ncbi:MAG: (4Fe-4S)-binding protein [Dehalococcoidia bacterium]|nr:(4Fe-4S)-binding protein [Dehalococcoidia bacterium]MSQ16966.1 (4Fe-4S)-binding protein [Dehalococcoidia bacterium]